LDNGFFDEAWMKLQGVIDTFFEAIDDDPDLRKRGQPKDRCSPKVKFKAVVPPVDSSGDHLSSEDRHSVELKKLARRVKEMEVRLASDHLDSYEIGLAIWKKIKPLVEATIPSDSLSKILENHDTPLAEKVPAIHSAICQRIESMSRKKRRDRIDEIKGDLLTDFENSHGRRCWRSVREPRPPPVTIISNGGGITADPSIIMEEATNTWTPVFNRPNPPNWEQYAECYAKEIESLRAPEIRMPRVTGMDFVKKFKKLKSTAAPGTDGRTVEELKRIPLPICILIADFWNAIMKCDNPTWPQQLTLAACHLIPKPSANGPSLIKDLRPISGR
jgi:hypothetical protein